MTENLTLEQKEKNKQYILDNLDKYVLDSRGSFYSYELEQLESEYYFIGSKLVKDYQEVKEKVIESVLKDRSKWNKCIEGEFTYELIKIIVLSEREDWELTFSPVGRVEETIKHKPSGMKLDMLSWDPEQRRFLVGELGYRGISYDGIVGDVGTLIWGEYDTKRDYALTRIEKQINKQDSRLRNLIPEPLTPRFESRPEPETTQNEEEQNNQSTSEKSKPPNQQKSNSQNSPSSTPSQPNQTPTTPKENSENKETNNPDKENKNAPLSNQDNTTNNTPSNPLPSSSEIQDQYDSDKDKSEIINNPNLTDSQGRQEAEKLLKLIIATELLIQKQQFNQEFLTKLLNEKSQNSPLYQMLNKEKRIDQAISQLKNVQQSQKNNNNSLKENKDNNQVLVGVICAVGGGILLLLGLAAVVNKNKKEKKK